MVMGATALAQYLRRTPRYRHQDVYLFDHIQKLILLYIGLLCYQ